MWLKYFPMDRILVERSRTTFIHDSIITELHCVGWCAISHAHRFFYRASLNLIESTLVFSPPNHLTPNSLKLLLFSHRFVSRLSPSLLFLSLSFHWHAFRFIFFLHQKLFLSKSKVFYWNLRDLWKKFIQVIIVRTLPEVIFDFQLRESFNATYILRSCWMTFVWIH